MTPCEALGYKVGDQFEFIHGESPRTITGDILTLELDDGTDTPLFINESAGSTPPVYRHLSCVKPLNTDSPVRLTLPTDSEARKNYPIYSGVLKYFPAALAGVAKHSKAGNDKHNPGQMLHHSRGKSSDHGDCIVRHLVDLSDMLAAAERGKVLTGAEEGAIFDEVNALCWRALALSQELHEQIGGAPLAPGAKEA